MIVLGYPGELIIEQDQLDTRWFYWALAMIPFVFIVYVLLVAQMVTVVPWLTFPVVDVKLNHAGLRQRHEGHRGRQPEPCWRAVQQR